MWEGQALSEAVGRTQLPVKLSLAPGDFEGGRRYVIVLPPPQSRIAPTTQNYVSRQILSSFSAPNSYIYLSPSPKRRRVES